MSTKDILFGVTKDVGIVPQARWIVELKAAGSNAEDVGASVVMADSGDIIVAGWVGPASGTAMGVHGYLGLLPTTGLSTSGNIVIYQTSATTSYLYLYKICKTSGGYIVVGKNNDNNDGYLGKFDVNLNVVFQNSIYSLYVKNCAVDSSGNIYITGLTATANDIFICKLSSTGTLTWATGFTTTTYDFGTAIATDSSANVYVAGTIASATQGCLLAKYNTAGTLQWKLTLSPTATVINNIVVGTSGVIYLVGNNAANKLLVMAINSSGTILWQRTVATAGIGRDLSLDSAENVYAVTSLGHVLKYNTSGVLQWSRRLTHANSLELNGITADTNGNIYVTGFNYANANNMIVAKLAMTGADISAVGSFTYVDTALSDSAGNITSVTSTLVTNTPSMASTTVSYITSSQTLSLTKNSTGTI